MTDYVPIVEQFTNRMDKVHPKTVLNDLDLKDCHHQFRKSEPSRVDENYTLIWYCIKCNKQVSST